MFRNFSSRGGFRAGEAALPGAKCLAMTGFDLATDAAAPAQPEIT
jgi:hypothetical protein